MKSIKFTDQELDSMIEMYTAEMEEAQLYIAKIQELLKKLGAKPAKAEEVEKETKVAKKRGRKPAVKVVEKAEPKKRGRKPKVVVPTLEVTLPVKPVKKEKKVAKVNVVKKPVVKSAPIKKAAVKASSVPTATAKTVPVAATKANTKKKVEPKPSVPTAKPAPIAAKAKKEVAKPEPKPKKIAAKVEKKPVVKPAPKKKPESNVAEQVKAVVGSLLTAPKKEAVKKVGKKKVVRKSKPKGVTLVKLSKPLPKKEPVVEPKEETAPVEPTIVPTGESKE